MDFNVLGPLRAVVDGVDVDVRGAKERTLLSHLIAYAGQVVPTTALIDSLWGESPPRSAAKSLQTYVLRLRNALEPDRDGEPRLLVTAGAGYRLAITPRDTDAGRFTQLASLARHTLDGGRPSAADEAARDALALWRGPAYAGCEDTSFGRAEARRLTELRLVVEEIRMEAMLDLGQERAAAPELERLVGEHPLRERRWEMLMLATYRSGQQGRALDAYERARAVLSEELGVDPGPGLRDLHRRVLGQDPALQPTRRRVGVPPSLRVNGTALVGREAELDTLRTLWQRAVAGATTHAIVRGPVGAGATALASALAHEVAGDGHPVLLDDDAPSTTGPWLRVVDGASGEPEPGAMVLGLAGPGAVGGEGATVLDLAPFSEEQVREVVSKYAVAETADAMARTVLESGVAWPGHVHATAARFAREAVTSRLADAVDVVGETSVRLASARAEVSATIVSLEEAREDRGETNVCPWRGLASYDVEHAPWFAGREHLVAELLSRLASTRLLAIVGHSGSGKSSALRAGVLASLASDVLPGSSSWRQVVMRPGRHPMRALTRAALGNTGVDVSDLLAQLIRTEGEVPHTLLVVDQMEEVWTACEDPGERAAFLDTLVELLGDPRSTTSVVLAVRADYVGEAAEHPELASLMADGTVLVGSPTDAEVARAITRPAARAGLVLEDGLAQTMVHDAGREPGMLPLLSVALTQVWEHRDGDRLTYAGYVRSGGINGAIGTLAESVWSDLTEDEQGAARVLLLRLAGPGEGAGVVRRRVPFAEVESLARPGLRRVVDRLADARLVTVGDGHVEVAHEALFREWPRLRGWLSDDAAGRSVQRRLALAAAEWNAEGRDATGLWRGARLQAGLDVAALRPEEMTHVEQDFLEAGRAVAEVEEQVVRERAEATARQNRRLRWMLVGLAAFLVLALVAGAVALAARGQAEDAAGEAVQSARRADARALAADALNEERPALALLQAVEATERDAGPETYGALLTMLTRSPEPVTRVRIHNRFLRIEASEDGSTVYLSDNEDRLRAVDATTAEVLWEVPSPEDGAQWGAPAADPGGRWIAAPVLGDPEGTVLAVLDAASGAVLHEVTGPDLRRVQPDTSPWVDESALVLDDDIVLSTESHLFVVDPGDGRVVRARRIPSHTPFALDFPEGRVAYQDESGSTIVVNLRTGGAQRREGAAVGVSDDGRHIVTSTTTSDASGVETSELQLRDERWRPLSDPWRTPGFVRSALFIDGGRGLAVAVDESLLVFDVRSRGLRREVHAHSGALLDMVVADRDDDLIWTAGRDGNAVALDLRSTQGVLRRLPTNLKGNTAAAAGGVAVVSNYYDTQLNTLSILDLRTGEDRFGEWQPLETCECQPAQTAITPDGRLALVTVAEFGEDFELVTDRGRVLVVDTTTGDTLRTITTPWEASGLAVSPDGEHVLVNGTGGYALVEVATGEEIWRRESELGAAWTPGFPLAGFAPDGEVVALARDESVLLVDAATGEELRSTELEGSVVAGRLVFGADGETLVVGSQSGRLYFLDAGTLRRTHPDRVVTAGYVFDVQLSPDGSVMAVMGSDGDVTLFDTATWKPYGKPVVDNLGWGFLSFEEDRLRIYGEVGPDYEIDTDPDSWVEAACRVANTEFTAEESALILPGQPVRPTCD